MNKYQWKTYCSFFKPSDQAHEFGRVWLFFGCRQKNLDLYQKEKEEMVKAGVLDKIFLALSREPGLKKVGQKVFIQELM